MSSYITIIKGIDYFRRGKVIQTHGTGQYEFYTVVGDTDRHYVTVNKRKELLLCTCKHGSLKGAANGDLCSHKIAVILDISKNASESELKKYRKRKI